MLKEIVVINGMAQSGKDTFVQLVSKHISADNYSSVKRVKGIAKLCGWNGEKDERSRQFLCKLKELTTEFYDMSYKAVVDRIIKFYESDNELLFVHIREPLEIQRIVDNFDAKTLLVERENNIINITSNEADKNVFNYNYDYVISNDGTVDDLEEKAKLWLERLKE